MLKKKDNIYSNRPVLQMAGELIGWDNTLGLLNPGEQFRMTRRGFHQVMGTPSLVQEFWPLERQVSHRLLQKISEDPKNFHDHVIWMYAANDISRIFTSNRIPGQVL